MQLHSGRLTHVCGVEDVGDLLQRGVLLAVLLLADHLDAPQFSKIKVPLLLHVLDGGSQGLQLWGKNTDICDR